MALPEMPKKIALGRLVSIGGPSSPFRIGQAGESGCRGVPSASKEAQSASSPAGVSVEFSLLAGPVGKTGDWIIFDRR